MLTLMCSIFPMLCRTHHMSQNVRPLFCDEGVFPFTQPCHYLCSWLKGVTTLPTDSASVPFIHNTKVQQWHNIPELNHLHEQGFLTLSLCVVCVPVPICCYLYNISLSIYLYHRRQILCWCFSLPTTNVFLTSILATGKGLFGPLGALLFVFCKWVIPLAETLSTHTFSKHIYMC